MALFVCFNFSFLIFFNFKISKNNLKIYFCFIIFLPKYAALNAASAALNKIKILCVNNTFKCPKIPLKVFQSILMVY